MEGGEKVSFREQTGWAEKERDNLLPSTMKNEGMGVELGFCLTGLRVRLIGP